MQTDTHRGGGLLSGCHSYLGPNGLAVLWHLSGRVPVVLRRRLQRGITFAGSQRCRQGVRGPWLGVGPGGGQLPVLAPPRLLGGRCQGNEKQRWTPSGRAAAWVSEGALAPSWQAAGCRAGALEAEGIRILASPGGHLHPCPPPTPGLSGLAAALCPRSLIPWRRARLEGKGFALQTLSRGVLWRGAAMDGVLLLEWALTGRDLHPEAGFLSPEQRARQ